MLNVEQNLSSRKNKKQVKKLSADISKTETKISKLVDLHLREIIDIITYEQKYSALNDELEKLNSAKFDLEMERKILGIIKTIKLEVLAMR